MALQILPNATIRLPSADPEAGFRAVADLYEARALLRRLVDAEDRIGLVYPVMEDARRFLAAQRRRED
ncbi:MAG: hypothetical protein M3406_08400 [Chloroflexota bacterium]|nr:hypothetical protein [Chloroflexota bacterium]